jgi:hypothetical protein
MFTQWNPMNTEVYSSFASIYINPVVYSLLIKVAWGAVYIKLLISGAKVKGRNYFTKQIWIHKKLAFICQVPSFHIVNNWNEKFNLKN